MKQNTILCVDDEASVLNALKRLLRNEKYEVLTAEGAEKGLEILKNHDVQLVISDYRMPHMDGAEFLEIVQRRYPDTLRIILSGYAEINNMIGLLNNGCIYRFLLKPWDYTELSNVINDGLTDHHNRQQLAAELTDTIADDNIVHAEEVDGLTDSEALIFSELPCGVLSLDENGFIVDLNNSAQVLLHDSENLNIGDEAFNRLPEAIVTQLRVCLSGMQTEHNFIYTHGKEKLHVQAKYLNEQNRLLVCFAYLGVEI